MYNCYNTRNMKLCVRRDESWENEQKRQWQSKHNTRMFSVLLLVQCDTWVGKAHSQPLHLDLDGAERLCWTFLQESWFRLLSEGRQTNQIKCQSAGFASSQVTLKSAIITGQMRTNTTIAQIFQEFHSTGLNCLGGFPVGFVRHGPNLSQ